MPQTFEKFYNCRIVLDATEVAAEVPKNFDQQNFTYSNYKHRNTIKILIGIATNGVITFCSQAFPGCISDKDLILYSGVLNQLIPRDLILADKGFLIHDILHQGVSLNIPSFLSTPQFTEQQVNETYEIAAAHIHVERAIRRIKTFGILNLIRRNNFHYCSEIV